jgi:hypothetical protein
MLGRSLTLAPDLVAEAVDPAAIVASRTGPGGAAREPMLEMIEECRAGSLGVEKWRATTAATLAAAEESLVAQAAALAPPRAGTVTKPETRRS